MLKRVKIVGRSFWNDPELHDVIYGRPLRQKIKETFYETCRSNKNQSALHNNSNSSSSRCWAYFWQRLKYLKTQPSRFVVGFADQSQSFRSIFWHVIEAFKNTHLISLRFQSSILWHQCTLAVPKFNLPNFGSFFNKSTGIMSWKLTFLIALGRERFPRQG